MAIEEAKNKIRECTADYLNRLRMGIERALIIAGEKGVEAARMNGTYTDRTGNLRSSTGYGLYENGRKIIGSSFDVVQSKIEIDPSKRVGSDIGQKVLEQESVKDSGNWMQLVVVAGMEYSKHVSDKGYDVLDSAKIESEKCAKKLIKELK